MPKESLKTKVKTPLKKKRIMTNNDKIGFLRAKIEELEYKTKNFEHAESGAAASSYGFMRASPASQGIPLGELWALLKDLYNGEINNIFHDILGNLDTELNVIDSMDEEGKKLLELKIVSSSEAITKYAHIFEMIIGKVNKKEVNEEEIKDENLSKIQNTLDVFMEKIALLDISNMKESELKTTLTKAKDNIEKLPAYQLVTIKKSMEGLRANINNDNPRPSGVVSRLFPCLTRENEMNQESAACLLLCLENIQQYAKTKEEVAGGLYFILRKAKSEFPGQEYHYIHDKLKPFIIENHLQPKTKEGIKRCINTFVCAESFLSCSRNWGDTLMIDALDYVSHGEQIELVIN